MKTNKQRIIFIIVILFIIICCSVLAMVLQQNDNDIITKKESQAPTSVTQLETQTESETEKKNEIDEKVKSIIVGILKYTGEIEEKYDSEKVDNIINDFNYHKGIFISDRAKTKIIELLKETTDIEYTIDNNGYLRNGNNISNNDISQSINNLITGNKSIIIDYNPYYYCKLGDDICTFNIEKTVYMQKFKQEDTIIMILNPVKYEQEYESKSDLTNQIINNVNN